MITEKDEYKRLLSTRLEENWKSFSILLEMKHFGNCISIMCQALDQIVLLLFILGQKRHERENLIRLSIGSQKLYLIMPDGRKSYLTERSLKEFASTLDGWEKKVFAFGASFHSLSKNYNYLLKNPIQGMSDAEKARIHEYMSEYHSSDFPVDFTIEDIAPTLVEVFKKISEHLVAYIDAL